ncbi:DUF6522 family protein [Martelella endophytica]|uniref:Uncharacterized protein n=1 Tax=Martelella endophytica TaxID=1486262 RepID=A0A0D5LM89_MAREN|nr:DUF6522 family protein [Martelella endophytica]AJY45070.1 hypothetical protein TM49_04190 [Martelella endophytica]
MTAQETGAFIVRNADGQFEISAERLAHRFGLSVDDLHAMTARGLVRSSVEQGDGDDEGHWRLSFRIGNRRWRLTVREDGMIAGDEFSIVSSGGRSP